MANITRDAILDGTNAALHPYRLFDPSRRSGTFALISVDEGGQGGYARGLVTNQLVRFDVTGKTQTPQKGYRVRVTAMEDTGDAAGTLSPTGESWTGAQVPAVALEAASRPAASRPIPSLGL